ncbi:hypothetical protein DFJ77DRAFT_459808 [Powellomyces hirtus]|nr:hypothetical protein DFJ77DRAFT_459808 [Powellomyces hirtus]
MSLPTTNTKAIFGLPELGSNGTLFAGTSVAISTENNALYFAIAAALLVVLLLLLFLCAFNCCTRKAAGLSSSELGTGTTGRRPSLAPGPATLARHVSLPRSLGNPLPRAQSLAENRQGLESAAMAAANEFVLANNGRREFPVVKVHVKQNPDEMNLVINDSVVLNAVYTDGWAAGVSKRSGGPWFFPVICLGGSVPRVLVSQFNAGSAAKGGPPQLQQARPPRFSPTPIREQRPLPSPRSYAQGQQSMRQQQQQQLQQQRYTPPEMTQQQWQQHHRNMQPPAPSGPRAALPSPYSTAPQVVRNYDTRYQQEPMASKMAAESSTSASSSYGYSEAGSSSVPSAPSTTFVAPPPQQHQASKGSRPPIKSMYSDL